MPSGSMPRLTMVMPVDASTAGASATSSCEPGSPFDGLRGPVAGVVPVEPVSMAAASGGALPTAVRRNWSSTGNSCWRISSSSALPGMLPSARLAIGPSAWATAPDTSSAVATMLDS
jgi:hypothetical protein